MKRSAVIISTIITAFILLATAGGARAETAQKYDLAFGAYLGFGCATPFYQSRDIAFGLGTQPEIQFFVIDRLSITYRFLWERIYFDHKYMGLYEDVIEDAVMDIAPFMLGARYYFAPVKRFKMYLGLGMGCTVYRVEFEDTGWYSRLAFAMDVSAGLEYEVIDQLTVCGMFNAMVPNMGPVEDDENIFGRFMFNVGVSYYIHTTKGSAPAKAKKAKVGKKRG
ncbi:MAG TPA: outer membrane beta-barrel protein [Spirochaetota bacterium]|nr:outer membrane beta-barrel protein [Spirochaetota bacterium]HSA15713.1 outer membrane beta-barrel protein [Spirochaetota bacterium]